MATITSQGIGSGLDVSSIISSLVALERQPIQAVQAQKDSYQVQLSSWGRVQSLLDTLRSSARTLADAGTWKAVSASSGDTSSVTATASSGTSPGSYAVRVNSLAAAQMTAAAALPDADTVVGTGTLHIALGSWDAGQTSFTPKSGSTTIDIAIDSANDTLEQVRDRINGQDTAGVRASIVTDSTGARLVLTSKSTGVENGFRITVSDDDGDDTDAAGLSRLAFDPANAAANMTRTQAAANASATINGLSVDSASNELTNVVDGLSLKLLKTTAAAVEVGITRDSAAMRKTVTDFVDAYNGLSKLLRDQTRYDATSKSAGSLQGDRGAIGLQRQLRAVLGDASTASATYGRAYQVGLDTQTDGTISLKGSVLDAALVDPTELAKFFSATGATPAADGLAVRLRRLADTVLGTDGTVTSQQAGLRERMSQADQRIERMEDRVSQVEKRLRAQYTALDRAMGNLNGLQGFVSQQLAVWNRQT